MKSLLIEPLEARIAPATLTISSPTVHEADTGTIAMTFVVTLDRDGSNEEVTVNFATVDGTATVADLDYLAKMGTLTFAPGETSKTIEIEIIGDTIGEADETFKVQLSDPVNASIENAEGIGTIKNDAKFKIVGPGAVAEGNAGTTNAQFTVTIEEAAPDQEYSVDFATVNGTAAGGATGDFQSLSGTLTFAAGETSKVIDVVINGDTAGEANETFAVQLSNAVGGATITTTSASATIENDDPVFTIDPATVVEGDSGTTILRFKVTLTHADPGATTTVKYATSAGTATAGKDYVAQSGTLTFEPGETEKYIEVIVNGDTVGEEDETLTVTLSEPTGGAAVVEGTKTATGTIVNDDPVFSIEAENPEGIIEGDTGTKIMRFKVTLTNPPTSGPITVNYATSNGTAAAGLDYIAKSGTLTFEEGETEKWIEVLIIGDTLGEDDETFFVTLSNPSTGGVIESTKKATGTILNDAKLVITRPSLLVEGDTGSQSTNFVVTLVEANPNATVTVNYSTADGSALEGEDYVSKTGTLTFGPGVTSQTISISVNGDSEAENDETFSVILADADGATIQTDTAVATIQNNDYLTVNDVTIVEGDFGKNTLVFTITLNSVVPSGKQIRVNFNTVDGTARASTEDAANDYVGANGTLIFEAGERTKTVTIEINGDQMYEGGTVVDGHLADQFELRLGNVELWAQTGEGEEPWEKEKDLNYGAETGSDLIGVATIVDNDPLPAVSISDARVIEGHAGNGKVANFTVNLSQASDFDVRVVYVFEGETAQDGVDFEGTTFEVIIPAGQTSAVIAVPIIGDTLVEGNETFKVRLQSAKLTSDGTEKSLALIDAEGTGTIVDDEVIVTVTAPGTIIEGDDGEQEIEVTVSISGTHTAPVVVNYYTQDGTATSTGNRPDYVAAQGQITFDVGQTTQTIKIKIKGDTEIEGSQDFKLIFEADGVQFGDDPDNASGRFEKTLTIQDNPDEALPTVTLENTSANGGVTEGGQATFKVNLSAPYTKDIIVRYIIVDGSAKRGSDYQYNEGAVIEVLIPAGQTSATFTINTIDDSLDEDPETFTVQIKEVQYGTEEEDMEIVEGGDSIGALIADNDAMPTLSIEDLAINEGNAGVKTAKFKIKLSAASGRDVTVNVATLPRDATAGLDFVSKTKTIKIPAGTTEYIFEVEIVGDQDAEGDESFLVQLTGAQNATIARNQAIGTIKDDESTYEVLFYNPATGEYDLSNIAVNEEGSMDSQSEVRFIVKRTGDLSLVGGVRYTTADGIAVEGIRAAVGSGPRADFTFGSAMINFAAGQEFSDPVTVKITKDTHYELTEQFRILLTDPVNGAVRADAEDEVDHGKVTIIDNDLMPTLTVTNVTVNEGNLQSNGSAQQTTMVFKVELSNVDETGTWNLKRKTIDGVGETGAISGNNKPDYLGLAEADLNFAPGEVSKNVTVTVYGDHRDEYDQTFTLDVRGTNSLGDDVEAVGTGTIVDDDAEVTVEITDLVSGNNSPTTYNESDGSTTSKYFQVKLSGETEKTVKVRYYTVDGAGQYDAKAGEDYVKVGRIEGLESDLSSVISVLTFNPGETSKNVLVTIINDTIVEGDQGFEMRIARHSEVPAGGETEADVTNAQIGRDRGFAVIKEDTNDRPIITINDITFIEGNDLNGTQTARFTVTLAEPAQRPVVVNFTTADGTGSASGIFSDYISRSGTITFTPGQITQNIDVQVINDIYVEDDETFAVKLTAPSGTAINFGKDTGIATILNGLDNVLGIGISDVRVVENGRNSSGGNTTNTAIFKVELSKAQAEAVTVNAAVRNGTATKGTDFENKNATVTIAANQKTADFSVAIVADNFFEATETFFADLSNPSSGAQIVKETGKATIYNDDVRQVNSRTVQWIDVDGDLVTLKVSKGAIDILNNSMFSFIEGGTVGGLTLQQFNLAGTGSMFDEANISITVSRQAGFDGDANGNLGDGRVNVGVIRAGTFDAGKVNFFGIDLGTIKIEGDLGTIEVGDRFLDGFALKKLDVYSFGMHPEILEVRNNGGELVGYDRQSYVQGRVGTIKVRDDFSGIMNVVASNYGSINSLIIGGTLLGNDLDNSGVVQFTGTLGKAVIGRIEGGSGDGSARIIGDTSYKAKIGSVVVKGDVLGGSGDSSGVIQTKTISTLKIGGEVVGGAGNSSAQIVVDKINQISIQGDLAGGAGAKSGYIVGSKSIGKVSIKGGVIGGAGADSGHVIATKISSISVQGDVAGGAGSQSGSILSNSSINKVDVKGRLVGGDGENSGLIRANGDVKSLSIRGAIPTGDDALLPEVTAVVSGGNGNNSGRIQVGGTLGSLTLGGAILPEGATRISLQGGDGADSGKVTANALNKAIFNGDIRGSSSNSTGTVDVNGAIKSMLVKGSLIGGDSRAAGDGQPAARVNTTGAIVGGSIGTLRITGNIQSGTDEAGVGLEGSGSVGAQGPIKKLVIDGSIIGNEDRTVNILAFGGFKTPAIGELKVAGDVSFTNVITGTSIRNVVPGQTVINADAEIRSVKIGGDVKGVNITAGANAGEDGKFGTADDRLLTGTFGFSDVNVYSKIAKVIIGGQVIAVGDGETKDPYGLIAQHIGSVTVGGIKVKLQKGAGNDRAENAEDLTPGVEIAPGTNFRAIELPIP